MSTDPDDPPDDDAGDLTRRFDSQTETPTTAVLEAIEAHSGIDATELPPLSERVSPDALNEFIQQTPASPASEALRVEFAYANYWVTVRSDNHVTVQTHQTDDAADGR